MLEELFKPMDIKWNMIISFVLHVAVITTSFLISYREVESILPKYYMLASIVEEKATVTSTASSPIFPHQLAKVYKKGVVSPEPASNNTGFFSNTQIRPELKNSEPRNEYGDQNDMRRKNDESEAASANNKVGTTILVNQHVSLSEETNMSHSNTKENKSDPASPSENPPISTFNKGQRGIEKGWGNGLPEQNTASKKIGESRSVDEISESTKKGGSKNNKGLYALIRSAIERAKSYPLLARKRGMEGTVLVSFKIDRKGFPGDIKIIKSSGYQILDEEVPKMLRKASPLPELSGEIVIPITFKLMESISNR